MDWSPALVWHTSDPYQDSGGPSTRDCEPSRWRGGAKQYQISAIPLNKMREIDEKIQVVVDSRMVTDGEATVYTSARFR
jgi:hypothetical protein